eukprot:14949901-Alexandrium_andersonii.AAC.1
MKRKRVAFQGPFQGGSSSSADGAAGALSGRPGASPLTTVAGVLGPRDLQELFAYPQWIAKTLLRDAERDSLLMRNVQSGILLRTHYSGMLTPEVGLRFFLAELGKEKSVGDEAVHACCHCIHSCDKA